MDRRHIATTAVACCWLLGATPLSAQIPSTGLTFWLDASDVNADGLPDALADGAAIGTPENPWASKIGGYLGVEPTEIPEQDRFPHYRANGINGAPSVFFEDVPGSYPANGLSDYNSDSISFAGFQLDPLKPYTVFIVQDYATPHGDGAWYSTGYPYGFHDGELLRQAPGNVIRNQPANGTSPNSSFVDMAPMHAPGAGIISYWTDALGDPLPQPVRDYGDNPGNAELWVNGTSMYTTNIRRRFSRNNHDLTVGQAANPLPAGGIPLNGLNGEIAEMIFYDRTLTPAEQNEIGYYLETKYGLSTAYTNPGASIPGDFDGDGSVNGLDLAKWKLDFGGPGSDADGDLDSDGNDFLIWQRNLSPAATPTAANVPEPAGYVLAAIGLIASACRRCGMKRARI